VKFSLGEFSEKTLDLVDNFGWGFVAKRQMEITRRFAMAKVEKLTMKRLWEGLQRLGDRITALGGAHDGLSNAVALDRKVAGERLDGLAKDARCIQNVVADFRARLDALEGRPKLCQSDVKVRELWMIGDEAEFDVEGCMLRSKVASITCYERSTGHRILVHKTSTLGEYDQYKAHFEACGRVFNIELALLRRPK
jgi:hypothetical protein